MIVKATTAGPMQLSQHAKTMIAQAMLVRGSNFLAAAILLKKHGGYQYVVLHLLCQGLEIIQKALLLSYDYGRFIKKLRDRSELGHDLLKGANAIVACYRLRPMKPELENELKMLNGYYADHLLRYASAVDILIDARSIPYDHVLRRAASLVRLGRRKTPSPNSESSVSQQPTQDSG